MCAQRRNLAGVHAVVRATLQLHKSIATAICRRWLEFKSFHPIAIGSHSNLVPFPHVLCSLDFNIEQVIKKITYSCSHSLPQLFRSMLIVH